MSKVQNLVGKKFGRLKVIAFDRIENLKTYWTCLCDCGATKSIRSDGLKGGGARSCGCLKAELNKEFEDLSGMRFSRLRVICVSSLRSGDNGIMWECKCKCGTFVIVRGHALRNGHTKSCGCFHRQVASELGKRMGPLNKRHGMTHTREYETWHHIHQRCQNTNDHNYGGRGIRVCKRWNKFENFLADMGRKPSPRHQIDRFPDNDGDYEPNNCRWSTPKEQSRNKRNNVLITYKGRTQCMAAWAEEYGKTTERVWHRMNVLGWSIHNSLTLPIAKNIREKKAYKHLRSR